MQYVEDQARDAGVVVPLISNDAAPDGHNAPGTGKGAVDIYGHDGYPLGFDCSNPTVWPTGSIPTNYWTLHEEQSPGTPYSIVEVCYHLKLPLTSILSVSSSKAVPSIHGVEVASILVLSF